MDGSIANNLNPLFGRYQNQIPYVITSPPHQPVGRDVIDDVSEGEEPEDEEEEEDEISLSTIAEVPSTMAGTLSPSEYQELGSALDRRRYRTPRRSSKPTRQSDWSGTWSRPMDNQLTTAAGLDDRGRLVARRRRLTVLLTSAVVVFFVILVAIVVVLVVVLGTHYDRIR